MENMEDQNQNQNTVEQPACLFDLCGEKPAEGQTCGRCGDGPCNAAQINPDAKLQRASVAVNENKAKEERERFAYFYADELQGELIRLRSQFINGLIGNVEYILKCRDFSEQAWRKVSPPDDASTIELAIALKDPTSYLLCHSLVGWSLSRIDGNSSVVVDDEFALMFMVAMKAKK